MPLFTFIVLFRALSVVGTRPRSSIFSSIALAMVALVRLAVVSLAALGLSLVDAAALCRKLFADTLHGHLSLDGCSNELVVGEAGVLERLRQYAGRRQLQRGVHVHQVVRFATENIANAFACLPAQHSGHRLDIGPGPASTAATSAVPRGCTCPHPWRVGRLVVHERLAMLALVVHRRVSKPMVRAF